MKRQTLIHLLTVGILVAGGVAFSFANGSTITHLHGMAGQDDAETSATTRADDAPHVQDDSASQFRRVLRYSHVPYTIYVPASTPRLPGEVVDEVDGEWTPAADIPTTENHDVKRFSISTGEATILLDEFSGETWLLNQGTWVRIPREAPGAHRLGTGELPEDSIRLPVYPGSVDSNTDDRQP